MSKKVFKIAINGNKGGIGKTATVMGLADSLRRMGEKCILIDWDKQRNLTKLIEGANSAQTGIADLLMGKPTDTYMVDDHIELVAGSPNINTSEFANLRHDTISIELGDTEQHIIVDLNPTITYSVTQSMFLCDTFLIMLIGDRPAFEGAMELAVELNNWNIKSKKKENAIRYAFVHNSYRKCANSRTIDEAIQKLHPTIPLFHVSHRVIIDQARHSKLFISQANGDAESKKLILGEYDAITNWILGG